MICFMLRYMTKPCLIIDLYACYTNNHGQYLIIHCRILFSHGKGGALEGEQQQLSLLLKTQPHAHVQKYSRHFLVIIRKPGCELHRTGRHPAPRRHLHHIIFLLQHLAKQPGHPHIEGGLNEGKWQPMVLLTKLKYKEAIALDGGIREATAVLLTRLRRLPVCVEGSLGQNGLFGGP